MKAIPHALPRHRARALREAHEEAVNFDELARGSAGIYDLDVHPIPARGAEPAHEHFDIRFALVADPHACEPTVVSDGDRIARALDSSTLDTLSNGSLPYGADESVLRLARKAVSARPSKREVHAHRRELVRRRFDQWKSIHRSRSLRSVPDALALSRPRGAGQRLETSRCPVAAPARNFFKGSPPQRPVQSLSAALRREPRGSNTNWRSGYRSSIPFTFAPYRCGTPVQALARLGGRLVVKTFPNSQLGGQNQVVPQLRLGAIELCNYSSSAFAGVVPASEIDVLGFAFRSPEQACRVMDGPLGAYVRDQFSTRGLYAFPKKWDLGMWQMTTSTKAVQSVEGLAGPPEGLPACPGVSRVRQHIVDFL